MAEVKNFPGLFELIDINLMNLGI
jgi:ATP-binding cassette, subfamily A (ABC1), member 3